MNEQLEYAEMLEIPVSTVNVVKKRTLFKRRPKKQEEDLKQAAITAVNERCGSQTAWEEIPSFRPQEDTVPVDQAISPTQPSRVDKLILGESIAACVLALGIFVTNVFMPDTLINTFVGNLGVTPPAEAVYSDYSLAPVVSDLSSAVVSVSDSGVITFTDRCAVYPVCNGTISSVKQEEDGFYTLQIDHSSQFSSIVSGVSTVYYAVGEEVKGRVPVAYSDGNNEVKISLFNEGQLLNCYSLTGALPVWNS